MARLAYLQSKAMSNNNVSPTIDIGVVAAESTVQFLANFSIGEPPVSQLVTVDTGSNLLWVQCLPCVRCFEQSSPVFDPSKSSTYRNLDCNSGFCSGGNCDLSKNCKFSLGYVDGTHVAGLMATEKLTFSTSDEGLTSVTDVIIGCGHNNNDFDRQQSGILGLGPNPISLVNKLDSKFSYCLGRIRDPNYMDNQLIFGDAADMEGFSTSLEVFNSLYYLNMEKIIVGEKALDINPETFKRTNSGAGGTVIDSGTTITFLSNAAFDALAGEVKSLLEGVLERVNNPDQPSQLCYRGRVDRDLEGFPVVTFGFAGGAELGLDAESMFQENGGDEFCMAVHGSNLHELNVIGVMAQQNYNIGYDLLGKKIFFQRIDCQLLD